MSKDVHNRMFTTANDWKQPEAPRTDGLTCFSVRRGWHGGASGTYTGSTAHPNDATSEKRQSQAKRKRCFEDRTIGDRALKKFKNGLHTILRAEAVP